MLSVLTGQLPPVSCRRILPRGRGTLLHVACASRSTDVAKYLAAQPEVDRLARNADGFTPFRLAMLCSAVGCVQALLAFPDVIDVAVEDVRQGLADIVAVSGKPYICQAVPSTDNMSAQAKLAASHELLSALLRFDEMVAVVPDVLEHVDGGNPDAVATMQAACRAARSWRARKTVLQLRYATQCCRAVNMAQVALAAAKHLPSALSGAGAPSVITVTTADGGVRRGAQGLPHVEPGQGSGQGSGQGPAKRPRRSCRG